MRLFILAVVALFSFTAFAQQHMVGFNADGVLFGRYAYALRKDRTEQNAKETQAGSLSLNYAYAIAPLLQLGTQLNYFQSEGEGFDFVSKEAMVGVILNSTEDLRNAFYVSLFGGMDWSTSKLRSFPESKGEDLKGKIALGKRFSLSMFNLENLSYTPQISYSSSSSNFGSSFNDYEQEFSIDYLVFSVFF